MKRKFFGTLLSLLMIIGMSTYDFIERISQVVKTSITEFNKNDEFCIVMNCKIRDSYAILYKGDYL